MRAQTSGAQPGDAGHSAGDQDGGVRLGLVTPVVTLLPKAHVEPLR